MIHEGVEQIKTQVSRCGSITHGMLLVARKRGTVDQPLDINRLVEDMAALVEQETSIAGAVKARQPITTGQVCGEDWLSAYGAIPFDAQAVGIFSSDGKSALYRYIQFADEAVQEVDHVFPESRSGVGQAGTA